MAAFHITPHGAGPATGDVGPAVINVRRPRAATGEAPIAAELVLTKAEEALPPTMMRLPNLAAIPAPSGRLNKIFSILHWCFIALGSLIALWLIFGGRGGPKPTGDDLPAAPARAQVSTPAWNPPALDTAGDSNAPKWTPPSASSTPATAAEAPPSMDVTPPIDAPAAAAPAIEDTQAPSYDSWPQGSSAAPAETPAAEPDKTEATKPETAPEPQTPAAPAWQEASVPPAAATAGPVARTAARETPVADPVPGGEAHPLDLTVPVPQ